ncbi:hypothetical protein AX16_008646 [Volvariella volvacea WC 439]|nr:hypothetical protein AX16_008646 [Volvariella volvacea WC 439]
MPRGVLLTANLPQLQNLIKRDSEAYREEFLQQWNHFKSVYQIFQSNPVEQPEHFREIVAFLAQVASCYPEDTKEFPSKLCSLLLTHYHALSSDLRKALIQNIVLLRNKNVISSLELLQCLFPLLPKAASSTLQGYIRSVIVTDIRTANIQTKNHKLKSAVQAMLFTMVDQGMGGPILGGKAKAKLPATPDISKHTGNEAMWAIIISKELWKKRIWTDAKTVAIIALGCYHSVPKVQSASVHFFLGGEEEESEDEQSVCPFTPKEIDHLFHVIQQADIRTLQHRHEINKKTRSRDKKLQKALNKTKSKRQMRSQSLPNFSALDLLQDPQTFAERLYSNLNQRDKHFSLDHKVLLLQLLSRVMGLHKLCILGFYSYILKYLAHHQLRIPSILAALAQSVHDLTPPDALIPVIKKLAQEFVHPGVASEVIAAGINSIREICRRQPWAMEEELLGDLIEYKKSRDKSVMSAARGLLQLYREVNPVLLKKRERGKEASINLHTPLPFGHRPKASVGIDGLALLEEHLASNNSIDSDKAWEQWEIDSDLSDGSQSSGWINVSDDEQELVLSESESESENEKGVRSPRIEQGVDQRSTLGQNKILTPADFTLLNSLRLEASKRSEMASATKATKRKTQDPGGNFPGDTFLSDNDILGPRKKIKADYAERLAAIQKGREGREKYGSRGKQKEPGSSTTNREKAKNKPLMMILSSGSVKGKRKASLREKQQKLRAHINQAKKSR